MLFAGTISGNIRAIKYPIDPTSHDFQEHLAHSSSISKLALSHDDQFLFSVSEDGIIYMYRVDDKDSGKKVKEFVYADEVH